MAFFVNNSHFCYRSIGNMQVLTIILFTIIKIEFGNTGEPIFKNCDFCIKLQTPLGSDYDGPLPDQEEVSNLQKIVIYFFQIFFKKA